jgi:tetratricopeptide (TPR) repeat protein/tRNA A-37 threonylcarbamoyl transferase component Bud32
VLPGDRLVDELADAILDGTPIDWAAAESSSERTACPLVGQLRVLAAVADLHRGTAPGTSTLSQIPPSRLEPEVADAPVLWGHLRLVERIGRGAFGEVYRAWDTRLDREVALKLLPAGPSSGDRAASAIIHEGRLLARVRHPNVVTIYGAEQIADQIGLWMEFVRGHTLEQLLDQRKVVSAADAVGIGLELCRAMSAVHGAGLLHRDIKTHNVMRAEDGRIVLMDFGTGRELGDDASSDLAGTPLYLAPEVLQGQQATVRSDVYSFGVLLYHLATGSYPVHARTLREVRRAHERGERTPVRTARRDLPPKLARVIDRAVSPRPEQRYESADALGADLAALTPRPGLTRLAYAAGMGAVSILVAGAGWEVVGRQVGSSRTPSARLAGFAGLYSVGAANVNALRLTPGSGERRYTTNLEAYELYLKARELVDQRSTFPAQQAVKLFEQAIGRDPSFALAYAGLAEAYAAASEEIPGPFRPNTIPPETALALMGPAVETALQLDPLLAEAHAALGILYSRKLDWQKAEESFRRAIDLNPSLTQIHASRSISTLIPLGKLAEAEQGLRRALQSDPLSLSLQRELAWLQFITGRYEEAIDSLQHIRAVDPHFSTVDTRLARALTFAGRPSEALRVLESRKAEPGVQHWMARAYVLAGRRAEAERLTATHVHPFRLAVIYAALGDNDRAFEALDRAAVSLPQRVGLLLRDPEMAALRGDPRFDAVREKLGLP